MYEKNKRYNLIFVYKVNKSWILNLENTITIAHMGSRDKLDISVIEGVEERVLSIDCKKHVFHLEPFHDSIASLPLKEREDVERVRASTISKKAIKFVFKTLEDINSREAAE